MLLEEIINFCHTAYSPSNCGNICCTHPDKCPKSCETCLEQVHYPIRYSNGRLDYTCSNLLYYYVCKYTNKYESEIEYAFDMIPRLRSYDRYNVLSLGCGASPDLIAIEQYNRVNNLNKSIDYWGVDLNQYWKPIHKMIENYAITQSYGLKYIYDDVTTLFDHICYKNFNILTLQYLISFFYNNACILSIDDFYNGLIENVIKYMLPKSIIIINDVNSNRRGRDYFTLLSDKLLAHGIKNTYKKRYFNYNIQNPYMCYGDMYCQNTIKHSYPPEISFYDPWEVCSSAQLIIELE